MISTKIVVVMIIVLILGAVGIYYLSSQPISLVSQDNSKQVESDEGSDNIDTIKEDSKTTEDDSSLMVKSGSYEAYSPEKLSLANSGKVVLFFRASWCPYCKELDGNIKANLDKIPDGVTILDVNYDNSSELKQKYGVTYQHTLVQVDAQGNRIKKWVGSPTLSELISNIE